MDILGILTPEEEKENISCYTLKSEIFEPDYDLESRWPNLYDKQAHR